MKALSFAYERVLRLHFELEGLMTNEIRYKLASGAAIRDARRRLAWLEQLAFRDGA